jgi:hypothetical protein
MRISDEREHLGFAAGEVETKMPSAMLMIASIHITTYSDRNLLSGNSVEQRVVRSHHQACSVAINE